ncbi:MAG: hypothetical protein JJU28_14260 [Cyclobacteriaceae bacterium]|nr:hypothetical protein [Cyclobacteriaceae bacterium]
MKKILIAGTLITAIYLGDTYISKNINAEPVEITNIQIEDEREIIEIDKLPGRVIKAWDKSDFAQNKVKEIYKVKKGKKILYYEIMYIDAAGKEQTVAYDKKGKKML